MLLTIVATAAALASKFGSALIGASAIGPIVHQFIVGAFNGSNASSKVLLLSADDKQSCVTVSKDEQSCVAETLVEVSGSNEMVQPVPLAMVQYKPTSNGVVMNLSNESIGNSLFDTLTEELASVMVIITILAAWYRSRIVVMLQSAMKMFFGTAHGCTNQQKEFIKATYVIQVKICLLVALAIKRLKETIYSYNISTLLGPLLPIGAEVKVQQHLCCAAGTTVISLLQHLAMLFAVVKGVLLGYKPSSSSHLPGMKQFASMLLVLYVGVLALSTSWGIHPIISRSPNSLYDTAGLDDLVDLAASSSNAVSTGLSHVSFLPSAVTYDDDHPLTGATRSGLLDTQFRSKASESNEDLVVLNAGLHDNDEYSLWSGYDDGLVILPKTSTGLSLDWNAFDCIHLTCSINAFGAAHSSLIMICTLDLAQGAVPSQSFVPTHYFAVAVVKELDFYTELAILVDSRSVSSFDPYDLLSLELLVYSSLSSGAEETSNAPMFAELDTSEEGTPYVSESNGDLAELSLHEDLHLQLPDGSSSSSSAPYLSWDSTSYEVSASAQTEVAISSVLVYQPGIDLFTVVRWLPRPASSLIKASSILNTWELHQLVFMVLLLVVCQDSDTNTGHLEGTSKSLPTNSQDTLENEALFDDHGNEAEESLTLVTYKHKHVSRESTALRSDLGRHWNTPPKRRCRRSPRKRRKVTRYQPM